MKRKDLVKAFTIAEYCWEQGSQAYFDLIKESKCVDLDEFKTDVYKILNEEVGKYNLEDRHLEMLFKATVGAAIMFPNESIDVILN